MESSQGFILMEIVIASMMFLLFYILVERQSFLLMRYIDVSIDEFQNNKGLQNVFEHKTGHDVY